MTLIDRYLRAVKNNLASEERDDIVSELAENIHAQMEDRASELGRALTEDEQAAVLKQLGNPMVVASRYRSDQRTLAFGRQLIGPELFPLYARVLAINVAITVAVVLIRALIGAGEGSVWSFTYGLAVPLAFQLAIVTGVFILIERHFARTRDRWDPRSVRVRRRDECARPRELLGRDHRPLVQGGRSAHHLRDRARFPRDRTRLVALRAAACAWVHAAWAGLDRRLPARHGLVRSLVDPIARQSHATALDPRPLRRTDRRGRRIRHRRRRLACHWQLAGIRRPSGGDRAISVG